MSTVPPAMLDLARRLMAFEVGNGGPPQSPGYEPMRVFEILRTTLTKLMGVAGFRALFSRALALAREDVPELRRVRVREDGFLENLSTDERTPDAGISRDGETILLGQFLGLMVTFIGTSLTMRLIHDTWPKVSMDSAIANDEEKNI